MANNILHLVAADYFRALPEAAPYVPETFEAEGFIHCTREPEVLLKVANQFYKDVPGEMLILVIDADRVRAEVRWEPPAAPVGSPHPDGTPPPAGEQRLFPHIYGPLNRDAIVEIRPARRDPEGTFLP